MTLRSHAQNLEDVLLYRALNQIHAGFYIDVGAQHPSVHSVTQLFYERGWHGINLDPCRMWFDELVRHRPRDINLCEAAMDIEGEFDFHEFVGTGLSTTVAAIAARAAPIGFEHRTYKVKARQLADICEAYVTGNIHFLKIDVEGAEKAVIEGHDFNRFRPWIVIVEATYPLSNTASQGEWEPLLLAADYEFCVFDRLNRWYVAKERSDVKAALFCPADDYERADLILKHDLERSDLTTELNKAKSNWGYRFAKKSEYLARVVTARWSRRSSPRGSDGAAPRARRFDR